MTDLTTLADRVEAGTVEMQRELLKSVADHLWGFAFAPENMCPDNWVKRWASFDRKLEAEAYVDAAMMLKPDGWTWSIASNGYAEVRHPRFRTRDCEGRAETPALALAAAALRAHASEAINA